MISGYDRQQFVIPQLGPSIAAPLGENGWPLLRILPDLILYAPHKKKVLVEVVNPKDAKRCIGEIVYLLILGYYLMIDAAVIFALRSSRDKRLERGLIQTLIIQQIFEKSVKIPFIGFSWAGPSQAYKALKNALTVQFQRFRIGRNEP